MSDLARWLARRLWFWMLWLMRRPWMKRLQRASLRLVRPQRRPHVWRSMAAQNRLARRYGLGLVTLVMNLLLASVIITTCYSLTLDLALSGAFSVPERPVDR